MDRRTFLGWVGVGLVASSLPVAIAACSSDTTAESTSDAANASSVTGGFQAVGTVADLRQKKQILNDKTAGKPVLVINDPAKANAILAVNPTCTHNGCIVEWKAGQKAFVCPCHDAQFDTKGKVLKGPATQPLQTYEAKVEGDKVLVKRG
ncbi:MAG: ubiquinol-cytochrome c reductase iron-sulfur subunit [Leptolyngbyaceae bacterium]|nr:ubiquinol-cytochrome c reductase iron-sulfur subunit [Leptolyngbyaceae bacterium]